MNFGVKLNYGKKFFLKTTFRSDQKGLAIHWHWRWKISNIEHSFPLLAAGCRPIKGRWKIPCPGRDWSEVQWGERERGRERWQNMIMNMISLSVVGTAWTRYIMVGGTPAITLLMFLSRAQSTININISYKRNTIMINVIIFVLFFWICFQSLLFMMKGRPKFIDYLFVLLMIFPKRPELILTIVDRIWDENNKSQFWKCRYACYDCNITMKR